MVVCVIGIFFCESALVLRWWPYYNGRFVALISRPWLAFSSRPQHNFSMNYEHICQSCGTRIKKTEEFGTNGDGHINEDFCINCFKDGLFTLENIEDLCHEKDCDESKLLGLKRWLDPLAQASWILDRCGYVTLSTIDEDGFPRPVAVDVLKHEGIKEIWFTTTLSSRKAKNLKINSKAGLSFVREADSVTLTGIAEVITDKKTLDVFWQDFFIYYFPDGLKTRITVS